MSHRDATPAVFRLLSDATSTTVDDALVLALPDMAAVTRVHAVKLLARRGHPASLAVLIQNLGSYEPHLQELVLRHRADLAAGVRHLIGSDSFRQRSAGINAIAQWGLFDATYLLVDALRASCPRTRKLAADTLHTLARSCQTRCRAVAAPKTAVSDAFPVAATNDRTAAGPDSTEQGNIVRVRLMETLTSALRHWDVHQEPKVVAACALMGPDMFSEMSRQVESSRKHFGQALEKIIDGTSDAALAPLVLWALSTPSLRTTAARTIANSRDAAFVYQLLSCESVLQTSEVLKACRWIRGTGWTDCLGDELYRLRGDMARSAVSLLSASGGGESQRIDRMKDLIRAGDTGIRNAAFENVMDYDSQAATAVLTWIAGGDDTEFRKRAADELRRRQPRQEPAPTASGERETDVGDAWAGDAQAIFLKCWEAYDSAEEIQRTTLVRLLNRHAAHAAATLRRKMGSGEIQDRVRALRIARAWGDLSRFERQIHQLARDADPFVRSLAVAMLPSFPGAATTRILREAVHDADNRVCANAVEAMDDLNVGGGSRLPAGLPADLPADLLESPDNRIRANTVKALLSMEFSRAGETLLDMMDDPRRAHRLSALWIVQHMGLRSVLDRIAQMTRDDPDERVRRRAERVCRELNDGPTGQGDPSGQTDIGPSNWNVVRRPVPTRKASHPS